MAHFVGDFHSACELIANSLGLNHFDFGGFLFGCEIDGADSLV